MLFNVCKKINHKLYQIIYNDLWVEKYIDNPNKDDKVFI